jgi:hypothetical protein
MNTKTIAIVVGVVVVLGAGYYFYSQSPTYQNNNSTVGTADHPSQATSVTPNTNPGSSTGKQVTAAGNFTGTMAQLASRGGSYKCTFDNSASGADTKGTVYVSADKVRGDFTTTAQGVPAVSHMLQLNGYTYMWSTITPAGVKLKIAPTNPANPTNAQYAVASASYHYDCQGWQQDSSVFQIPASVTFTSVN